MASIRRIIYASMNLMSKSFLQTNVAPVIELHFLAAFELRFPKHAQTKKAYTQRADEGAHTIVFMLMVRNY